MGASKDTIKILLVDCDTDSAEKARATLIRKFGTVDVVLLANGHGLCEFLASSGIDLVFFDNGAVRKSPRKTLDILVKLNSKVPVIAIFEKPSKKLIEKYARLGIVDHLIKDNNYHSNLLGAVSRFFDIRNIRAEKAKLETILSELGYRKNMPGQDINKDHEINNLLMTIMGSVQILLAKPNFDPVKLRERLKAIEDAARTIADFTSENPKRPEKTTVPQERILTIG